jgi:hypothetical protein
MHGFGDLKDIEMMKNLTALIESQDLIEEPELTEEEQERLNTIIVPRLKTNEYKAMGAAGNTPDKSLNKKKDPQLGVIDNNVSEDDIHMDGLGGMNLGNSIKKEMTRTEAFEENDVVDEAPMQDAKDIMSKNSLDDVRDKIGQMFGRSYQDMIKSMDIKYDVDGTKPVVIINEPKQYKNIKKGW